jgi:hypothetical protein
VKRPYSERARLLRLAAVTLAAGVVIVALGLSAVLLGAFDPSREERAHDWVKREYGAELGPCEDAGRFRLDCEVERSSPALVARLGRPAQNRVCVFVIESQDVVVEGWGRCQSPD